MRNLSGEESLLAVLPIVLVIIGLTAGILYYSRVSGDTRSRASYPTTIIPTLTPSPKATTNSSKTTIQPTGPSIACSQLYSPICGIDGITYANRCEIDIKAVAIAYTGECATKPTITAKPTTTPKPATNPNDLPSVQNFR